MKRRMHYGLSSIIMSAACSILFALPVFAADVKGGLEKASDTEISGWAYDGGSPETALDVELYVYTDGAETAEKLADVKANQYRDDLKTQLGYGEHGFTYSVNWDQMEGQSFVIKAYAVSGKEKKLLGKEVTYMKMTEYGPGMVKEDTEPQKDDSRAGSLGTFSTTAYCSCSQCSSGSGLTFSGKAPQANHTISADLNEFPLGTRLQIGDTIYTVEDKGHNVNGRILDIYFTSHEEALDYGRQSVEVFAVE